MIYQKNNYSDMGHSKFIKIERVKTGFLSGKVPLSYTRYATAWLVSPDSNTSDGSSRTI